ncbi:protein-glutamate O-methyltransferase CheR [Vibrio profundum]|uniref:CheR family methyltransferase n=1 Tax=Vibrio profundum TaxID=2910247 RepID=UPI003D0FF963
MGRVLTQNDSDLLAEAQEFELTAKDFKFIQWFMHKSVGIYLNDRKRAMVYGRVSRQLRRLGFTRFSQYRELIEGDKSEQIHFINSLTTNKTDFFREYHHFEFIEKVLMAEWKDENLNRLRIWSAGCSTGQEPYSFIAKLYSLGVLEWCEDVKLLASDLDTKVLEHAKKGVYSEEAIQTIPEQYLKNCFVRGKQDQAGAIKIKSALQKFIKFAQINLLDAWPMSTQFDLISCRNVMIYFDKPTQEKLLKRFHQQLKPNGVLFLGHSESVGACADIFHHLGHTIYVKKAG